MGMGWDMKPFFIQQEEIADCEPKATGLAIRWDDVQCRVNPGEDCWQWLEAWGCWVGP